MLLSNFGCKPFRCSRCRPRSVQYQRATYTLYVVSKSLVLALRAFRGDLRGAREPRRPAAADHPDLRDAAGCAGALAFTSGAPTYLTGVMVAVALLPPTVASGMLISAGEWRDAASALLLAGSKVTAVTLAAMLTFAWRGMRPRNWWLEERARSSARVGITVFVALLFLLGGLVFFAGQR